MAIKEAILAVALSTSPEACEQKTVSDQLSSCQNTIHQVMESKKNPHKVDENIMKVALKIGEKNPISTEFGYEVASNGNVINPIEQNKQKIILEVNKNIPEDTFEDEEEKEEFQLELELRISSKNPDGVKDLLIDYGFEENFALHISQQVPKILAGEPKVSVEELDNLANMDLEKVVKYYINTGKIPKGFESFKEHLDEIKILIKEREAIIRRGEEADRRGKEAEWKGKKAKEIEEKMKGLIEKMKVLKKNSGIA